MRLSDQIHQLTGGKPYAFVIMGYHSNHTFYREMKRIIEDRGGIQCILASEVKSGGHDLLAKIHLMIERAEVVIADINDQRPNVFYEIGYAVGHGRTPILLVQQGQKIPTDLKGLEVIEYSDDRNGMLLFERDILEHIGQRLNRELSLLRDMLEAPTPRPAVIVSSPKYPGSRSRIAGQIYDRRTFGDNLGILGLISAFGPMLGGEGQNVALLSAQHCDPDLWTEPKNLYLIGSGKVNPQADRLLHRLQAGREPAFELAPAPGTSRDDDDWLVSLYRTLGGVREELESRVEQIGDPPETIFTRDHGIVVRGPHPEHPDRMVLIMAGAHSLGTGAACLAATRSSTIAQIREKLPGYPDSNVLADKDHTLWALVRGEVNRTDYLLDADGVEVIEAGLYD
jgi:hypothetical protein